MPNQTGILLVTAIKERVSLENRIMTAIKEFEESTQMKVSDVHFETNVQDEIVGVFAEVHL